MKTYKEDNKPAFQFYPDDWISEPSLKLCSLEAKGLWIEMLCIMFKAEKRGSLTVNGKQISSKELAKLLSEGEEIIIKCLGEMKYYNVFTELEDGLIINRRMYYQSERMEKTRQARIEAGRKGGLKKKASKTQNKNKPKQASPTPTPSPSPTSKNIEEKKDKFEKFWDLYEKKVGEKSKLLKKFSKLSNKDIELVMDYIPKYKNSKPDKQFRKNPEAFLNNKTWLDEIIDNTKKSKPEEF